MVGGGQGGGAEGGVRWVLYLYGSAGYCYLVAFRGVGGVQLVGLLIDQFKCGQIVEASFVYGTGGVRLEQAGEGCSQAFVQATQASCTRNGRALSWPDVVL